MRWKSAPAWQLTHWKRGAKLTAIIPPKAKVARSSRVGSANVFNQL